MTTVVGIKTPEGIVLASDLLRVKWNSNGGKNKVLRTEEGFRKIYQTADGMALLACAYQMHPGYVHLFEGRMNEVLKTSPAEELSERLRDRIGTVLMASDLEHHQESMRGGTEFEALIAYVSDGMPQLVYQFLCHPVKPVETFAVVGSGKKYAAKKLQACSTTDEAVRAAESAIKHACRWDAFSKGLNIMVLNQSGIKEIKFGSS